MARGRLCVLAKGMEVAGDRRRNQGQKLEDETEMGGKVTEAAKRR